MLINSLTAYRSYEQYKKIVYASQKKGFKLTLFRLVIRNLYRESSLTSFKYRRCLTIA
jgi:hypothetical protein